MGEARRKAVRGQSAGGSVDVDALLTRAKVEHERRDFPACIRLCERVLAHAPRHSDARHLMGLAQIAAGAREHGIASLRQAIDLDPDALTYRFNLGLALRAEGDLEGAALCFAWVGVAAPESNPAHYQHAITLDALGHTRAAEAAYRRAIAAAPNHVNSHCGLARALYERGAMADAMAAQAWAVALDPTAADEGRIGFARGEPGTAIALDAARAARDACRVGSGFDADDVVEERELKVVDDFEPDFERFRAFALGRKFADAGATRAVNFPGEQTPASYATAEHMQRIANALGRDIKWRWPANGAFRASYEASSARSDIHVDENVCRPLYAGVLYLSRPQDCRGGTSFWRHRATRFARVVSDDAAREAGFRDFRDFQEREMPDAVEQASFDALAAQRDRFERVLEVPMRANRLVLYRSDYFHSISEVFGTRRDDARLVQLFFFEPL